MHLLRIFVTTLIIVFLGRRAIERTSQGSSSDLQRHGNVQEHPRKTAG